MELRERLTEYRQPFDAILAVATCRDSLFFADLCWSPFDTEVELRRLIEGRDPGVIFETVSRVVVIEEHSGELRYYAGGWLSHESRMHLEQDRIEAEGYEMGVFKTCQDAVIFAECFLVREQALQDIEALRLVHHGRKLPNAELEVAPDGVPGFKVSSSAASELYRMTSVSGREKPMNQPPPLNLIRLGNEWLVTNGELAADGSIRFPNEDPAEEVFVGNGTPPASIPPSKPSAPRSES